MAQGYWAWIQPVEGGGQPDHTLPGGAPGYPSQGLPGRPGGPVDPGWGIPGGRPPHVGGGPARPPFSPGLPVDPGYGVPEGGDAGQLPIWPIDPEKPSHGLPPVPGHPLPPTDPPPGTIWPPLPPDLGLPDGKAIVLVAISGVGYRYAVIEIQGGHPDQGLPEEPEGPEVQPPQPGFPPQPGQPLPPTGRPPTAGQPLPPGAPVRPGQGLPPSAQPKRR